MHNPGTLWLHLDLIYFSESLIPRFYNIRVRKLNIENVK